MYSTPIIDHHLKTFRLSLMETPIALSGKRLPGSPLKLLAPGEDRKIISTITSQLRKKKGLTYRHSRPRWRSTHLWGDGLVWYPYQREPEVLIQRRIYHIHVCNGLRSSEQQAHSTRYSRPGKQWPMRRRKERGLPRDAFWIVDDVDTTEYGQRCKWQN